MNLEERDIGLEEEREVTLDLMEIIGALRNKIIWVLAFALFGAAVAYGISCFLFEPTYTAQVIMYVNNRRTNTYADAVSQSDLNASKELVPTYQAIVSTKSAMKRAINEGGISGYTPEQLMNMVSTQLVEDTGIFAITVRCKDQYKVADIANAIAQSGTAEISKYIEGTTATIIDRAVVPSGQSSPNNRKNAVLGFLFGAVLCSAVVLAIYFLDTRIKKTEDFAKVMNAPVLGIIQSMSDETIDIRKSHKTDKSGGKR